MIRLEFCEVWYIILFRSPLPYHCRKMSKIYYRTVFASLYLYIIITYKYTSYIWVLNRKELNVKKPLRDKCSFVLLISNQYNIILYYLYIYTCKFVQFILCHVMKFIHAIWRISTLRDHFFIFFALNFLVPYYCIIFSEKVLLFLDRRIISDFQLYRRISGKTNATY